jgi:hypothetical protein
LAEEHHIRVVYALQTLCGLVRSAFKKQASTASGVDLVNLLMGFDMAEKRMAALINHVNDFLMGEEPASLKDLCLKLLLIITTGLDNVSQNMLMELIMANSVFESLILDPHRIQSDTRSQCCSSPDSTCSVSEIRVQQSLYCQIVDPG